MRHGKPVIVLGLAVVLALGARAEQPTAEGFDHGGLDRLLRQHVDDAGWVDYSGLARDGAVLNRYIRSLAEADYEGLSRDAQLTLLINAYNAFTLRLILDHGGAELDSIMDIPVAERWEAQRWELAGRTVSLDEIEHEMIRPNFAEPRIHFAVVCAAVGCPPLRNEAYTADDLEQQLAAQADHVHSHDRWLRYDAEANSLHLTRLYDWYAGDFEDAAGSVVQYVARHHKGVAEAVEAGRPPRIEYLDYSWALNDVRNRPE